MLGSFGSSSHEDEEDPSPSDCHYHHHHPPPPLPPPFTSPAIHMRQLLINCAELISQSDYPSAHRLLTALSSNSSPNGDSTERLVHQFTKALSRRLNRHYSSTTTTVATATTNNISPIITNVFPFSSSSSGTSSTICEDSSDNEALVQSSYLTLNQVTPFIRFSHLTANQAILEGVDGNQAIHILDFDIMHGVQWPPLMQALAERYPPPTLRITGTGQNLETIQRTGDRLGRFAHSLGLRFQFHPLLLLDTDDPASAAAAVLLLPEETLAVNFTLFLHRLLNDRDRLRLFLHRIKAMNPRVVTVAEREGNHNHPLFLQRFVEAVDYYAAVFDSLEATLPPGSGERLVVERVWFGREIADIVAAEGSRRRERHERFRSWEVMLRSSGFRNVALSPFALSQAKLLLRLHYPSEGYQLHILSDSLFLGWQSQLLFSVSSWL